MLLKYHSAICNDLSNIKINFPPMEYQVEDQGKFPLPLSKERQMKVESK